MESWCCSLLGGEYAEGIFRTVLNTVNHQFAAVIENGIAIRTADWALPILVEAVKPQLESKLFHFQGVPLRKCWQNGQIAKQQNWTPFLKFLDRPLLAFHMNHLHESHEMSRLFSLKNKKKLKLSYAAVMISASRVKLVEISLSYALLQN